MSRFTESMDTTDFDSGNDAIFKRRIDAQKRPQPPIKATPKSYKPLLFDDTDNSGHIESQLLGPDLRSHMNDRRKQSEIEVEKFNRMGAAEYNRQTYGDKKVQVQLGFNDDGSQNTDLMRMVLNSHIANSQITASAPLDGTFETDISFLDGHDNVDGFNFLTAVGEKKYGGSSSSSASSSLNKAPVEQKKQQSKEIHLKYNERKKLPIIMNDVTKIKILVEYKSDMSDAHKVASLKIAKSGQGKEPKMFDVTINGEGKTLTGHSNTYFFTNTNDGYTDIILCITGPGVIEATLIVA
jgi:hypothetical protein